MDKMINYKNFQRLNNTIMVILVFLTLFPFLYVLAVSFSSARAVISGEVLIFPVDFNIASYKHVLEQNKFWVSYGNTILYTTTGTLISLALTIMCAYPLSKPDLVGKELIMKFIIFTMFFAGGLIPNFLLIRSLGMINTIWAMIIPGAVNAYNVMIMKTFFQGIPKELDDAARIDGVSDFGVLFKIYLPLSKPIIATIGLFVAVWLWNEWFLSLIYMTDDMKRPVSMFLRNMVMGAMNQIKDGKELDSTAAKTVPQTLQASTIILTSIPILMVYPFIQKHFTKGMLLGSVKG